MKPILEIQNISKKFRINHEQQAYLSLRDSLTGIFKNKSSKEDFWALKDVSFDVMPGDTVGIIGKNGAGKSTLLKILSKITPPTSGKIIGRGRVASLLEVGTGFHPELSGRENIFMNGSILGMRRAEILKNFDAIVDFAGVEKFIDTPLKHYSSGMQLRLAFAVAAFLENEILIIDEVLAVGDAEFQKKCMGKMGDISQSGRTILFVSHNMGAIRNLCNSGIFIKQGNMEFIGSMEETVTTYLSTFNPSSSNYFNSKQTSTTHYFIRKVVLAKKTTEYASDENIIIDFDVNNIRAGLDVRILLRILDEFEQVITCAETKLTTQDKLSIIIPNNFFKKGNYYCNVILYQPAVEQMQNIKCCYFSIIENNAKYAHLEMFDTGKVYMPELWE